MRHGLVTLVSAIALMWVGAPRVLCQRALKWEDNILWTVAWSPDGARFAVGGVENLWAFDTKTWRKTSLLPGVEGRYTVTKLAWNPSGMLLAASDQDGHFSGVYDIRSGKRLSLSGDSARGVSWGPKGESLAMSSAGDGYLRIWDSEGRLLNQVARYKESRGLTGVAWNPGGDRIVTIGSHITIHDGKGNPLRQIRHRPEADERLCLLLCVEWHPSGEFFAIGDYGNEVDDPVLQFWSAEGKPLMSETIEGGAAIRNVDWNSDGTLLASASDALRIWDRDGKLQAEGTSPDLLWGVDWHPKRDRILTSSIEGRVTVWDGKAKVVKPIVEKPEQ